MVDSLIDLMRSRGLDLREPKFGAPWEARAFALALELADRGKFRWEEFRKRLIDAVSRSDAEAASDRAAPSYYECWLSALEQSILAKTLATAGEIDQQAARIAANPPTPTKATSIGPIKIA